MKSLKYLIVMLFVFATACNGQKQEKKEEVKHLIVSADEFKDSTEGKEVQLIDVRTPEEYSEGHIANAKNINFNDDDFMDQMQKLNKDEPVYLYCRSGGRSGRASQQLLDAGFTHVVDLQGGITAWQAKDYKTVN